MKKIIGIFCLVLLLAGVILTAGCTSTDSAENKTLLVYCGAGMKEPMEEIAELFKEREGITIEYTYGGSAQMLSQIELYQTGDAYMPGALAYIQSAMDKGFIDKSEKVIYHVITIIVPKGNPANITSLEDLAKPGVRVAIGEPTGPAIGQGTKKMLEKDGLWEAVSANVVVKSATVNELLVYVAMKQADAALVYEDLYNPEAMDKIDIPKEQGKVDIVPIGTLKFSTNKEDAEKFLNFVASAEGKAIFVKHGFESYPSAKYGDA
ncbi:molybdate ABC transporter substrate-binding protein [Methanocorpusculum parvum]|jgi:molybdate transport system substrate-binding protein|uniref:Molybdenum ABC transporter substrate-binding protein n=1 Tax=Methanocorpusculum parvum TaxID=2193 RepID=A0AAX0Q9U1_9EURY|nr:molybdate ABC transporter substrate-binding protein [Methanocorpusculum parvum]MCK9323683.1 molybdate ABC transporter substrate-binding protein [Candidatus Methanomethylophilaceae archaeon]NLC91065.1 molybdate ABC transporter substrate-binding protein [Methanocorpusculum parvum]PAV10138.1 molybdenum ABC transporter substrate-binding protein [Methanocorpusculum parvum]